MVRSFLGRTVFRRYVAAIEARRVSGAAQESRTEGRWRRAREWLVRHGDPDVEMRIGRSSLRMPLSHELPVYRALFSTYDRLLPLIAQAMRDSAVPVCMFDIGANVGDTLALVHDDVPDAQFLCIEAHPRHARLLRLNAAAIGADVEVLEAFCADSVGVPFRMRRDTRGSAQVRFDTQSFMDGSSTTIDRIADHHARARDVTLLKIDTDGFDLKVVRGAARLIRVRQPLLYFEFHPALLRKSGDDPASVFGALQAAGYAHIGVYSNRGCKLCEVPLTAGTSANLMSRIDGNSVEYLDLLAWAPAHDPVVARLRTLEEAAGLGTRT